MSVIRNLLALIGLLAIVAAAYVWIRFEPDINAFQKFDTKAASVYMEMWDQLKATGNAAEATVWKIPVEEDISWEDVEQSMRSVANELNMKNVGELPLSEQVTAMTGEEHRLLKLYMFCDPLTAALMVDFNDAYSAYLPCRISLIEDKQGKLWLYTLNMDLMMHGGESLPAGLFEEAQKVRTGILEIMQRGAEGDF
jgi:uncharacterized protein (DUF302 family)